MSPYLGHLAVMLPDLAGALCAGEDTERWFHDGAPSDYVLSVCGCCPVRAECLAWATEHDEAGIWAGTTGKQRRKAKRRAA